MGKLAAVICETAQPNKARDRLSGDGDGLFLRIRPHGTKTWVIEYEFRGARRKYTAGLYVPEGAPGDSLAQWLRYGRLSLTQARSISGTWEAAHAIDRKSAFLADFHRDAGGSPFFECSVLVTQSLQFVLHFVVRQCDAFKFCIGREAALKLAI